MEERINNFLQISYGTETSIGYSNGTGEDSGSGVGYGTGTSIGSGTGTGGGYGSGNGVGEGTSNGTGFGFGNGIGPGTGVGPGTGTGEGYGIGIGYGTGTGAGEGYGYGNGKGILSFNKDRVYVIDNVQTIIKSVRGNIAKGFILNDDWTLTPCYIAKSDKHFAHGKTLRKAVADAVKKHRDNMSIEEKISEFKKEFKKDTKYPGHKFFDWHGRLTGSCEMGRAAFCNNNGINLDKRFTVKAFCELAKDQYGSDVIRKIAESYID